MIDHSARLINVTTVQSWLGQQSDAAFLNQLIAHVSRAILSFLGRPSLLPRIYQEIRNGNGSSSMMLRHWPVLKIENLTVDGVSLQAIGGSQSSKSGYFLEMMDRIEPPGSMQKVLLKHMRFARGHANVSLSYQAGYAIDQELMIVPSEAPYVVIPCQPYGAWGSDIKVETLQGTKLQAVPFSEDGLLKKGTYYVRDEVYSFSPLDAGQCIALTYGYIPSDIAQAAMEWVAERYSYKNRIGLLSKSLGGQETVSYTLNAMPSFVSMLLQPYRRVVVPC